MSAPRVTARAVKQLVSGTKQTRSLHMTGPATFSSLLTSERPALNLPGDVAGLRAECWKLQLPTTGTKAELIDRLSAHELTGARAFSTNSKRPIREPGKVNSGTSIRHFNTSRSLKAVNDSSTIDFAYIPEFDPDTRAAPIARVPILPETIASEASRAHTAADTEEIVHLPEIHTVAADSTHIYAPSAMSEVHDNNTIDFQGMAETVANRLGKKGGEGAGIVRELWDGLVDDVFGPKSGRGSHA